MRTKSVQQVFLFTRAALLALLLSPHWVLAEPEPDKISTRTTGSDSFEITLDSTTVSDVASATRRIAPTARTLCEGRHVELGRYEFDQSEAVNGSGANNWFQLTQQVRCVDSAPEIERAVRKPQLKDQAAADNVQAKVRELSTAYFYDLYANMGDDANAALDAIGGQADADRSAIFETAAGTAIEINLFRLTVYDNLPNAPMDGIYVAVDYDNNVGNVAHHCGYLMWHSLDAEKFSLGRVESGALTEELVSTMSERDSYAVRKQLRCSNVYDK